MTEPLIFAAVAATLMAAVLALILLPALKSRTGEEAREEADAARVELARDRRALEERHESGKVTDADYKRELAALRRRALDEASDGDEKGWRKEGRGSRIALSVILLIAIPVVTFLSYRHWGEAEILGLSTGNAQVASGAATEVARASDPVAAMKRAAEARGEKGITAETSDADLMAWCRKHPEDGRANVMMARRFAERHDFGSATEFFDIAIRNDQKAANPEVLTEAAAAMVSINEKASLPGRMRRAVEYLDRALAIDPSFGNAMRVRTAIAVERGEWGVAERMLRAMASKFDQGSKERAVLEKQADEAAKLKREGVKVPAEPRVPEDTKKEH